MLRKYRYALIATGIALLSYASAHNAVQPAQASSGASCLYVPGDKKSFLCNTRFGYLAETITQPSYTTGWIASTLGGGVTNQWMPTQAQGMSVNSDGTTYLVGYYDEGGKALSAIKNGVVTYGSASTILHQFGTGGSSAVASNGSEVVIGMQQRPVSGGTNPCSPKQPTSPASGHIWNALYIFQPTLNIPNSTCNATAGTLGGYNALGLEILVSDNTASYGSVTAPSGVGILPNNNIVVSDPPNNRVLIINGSDYTNVATITVSNPGAIYVDQGTGDWWVVTGSLLPYLQYRWIATQGYQLLSYTSSGSANTAGNITLPSSTDIATGMCEDGSGDLVIADSGSDQNFKVYSNPITSPVEIGTIGTTGGVFASPIGQVGNMRFQGPVGCGFDANGNFYAAEQPYLNGSEVESYNGTSSGAEKLWGVSTQAYIDGGNSDPGSSNAYTMDGQYTYNRNTFLGQEGTWTGVTYDPFLSNAGDDPRSHDITGFPQVRDINGNPYMFLQPQVATALEIFKKVGNLWQISALWNVGHFRTWPTSQPSPGWPYGWFWTDTAGDGVIADGTYSTPAPEPAATSEVHNTVTNVHFYVDSNANLWKPWLSNSSDIGGWISEMPLQGVDSNNNPIYTQNSSITKPLPTGNHIRMLYNIAYDATSDTMYADGFPTYGTIVNDCVGGVGRNLEAYSNWSTTPVFQWSVALPYNCSGGLYTTYSPYRITQAGNYIFGGAINPNVVWVFNKSDGSRVQLNGSDFKMTTNNPNASNTGNLDEYYPIDAVLVSPQNYDIFQEEDGRNKVIVFHATLP